MLACVLRDAEEGCLAVDCEALVDDELSVNNRLEMPIAIVGVIRKNDSSDWIEAAVNRPWRGTEEFV